MSKIVIDGKKIEDEIARFAPHRWEWDRGYIDALRLVLQQSQPLEEIIKPLLEDAYKVGFNERDRWGYYDEAGKETAIQSILNKLKDVSS